MASRYWHYTCHNIGTAPKGLGGVPMRRLRLFLILLLVLAGVAAAVIYAFEGRIGDTVYARAIDQRVGRDATAALPAGMALYLCGTGSPLPDPDRAGPCAAVIVAGHIYVVDAGEGASRKLALAGMPMGRLSAVLLTHFHSDHIDGLGPMMLLRWTGSSATRPLPIYGPDGVQAVVAGFNAAYATDNGYRVAHHGPRIVPPSGAGGSAMPFPVPPANGDPVVVMDHDGLKITAFRVDHGPVSPAVGYRFDYRGRSIVISGDTSRSANVVRNARGADILLHEALQPVMVRHLTDALSAHGQRNTAQITRDIVDYHATPEQAADVARTAGVRQLVLTHLVPPLPSAFFYPAFLGDAASRYAGPITVGEDGMLFVLPAGGTDVSMRRLL